MGNINGILSPKIDLGELFQLRSICNNDEKEIINKIIPKHISFDICKITHKPQDNLNYLKSTHDERYEIKKYLDSDVDLHGKYVIVKFDDLKELNAVYKKYHP